MRRSAALYGILGLYCSAFGLVIFYRGIGLIRLGESESRAVSRSSCGSRRAGSARFDIDRPFCALRRQRPPSIRWHSSGCWSRSLPLVAASCRIDLTAKKFTAFRVSRGTWSSSSRSHSKFTASSRVAIIPRARALTITFPLLAQGQLQLVDPDKHSRLAER